MIDLEEKYIRAVFALIGVLLGALMTFFANLILKRNELKLKLREKVLDKRIQAHENIIKLSITLRTMNYIEFNDPIKEVKRIPMLLSSMQRYIEWSNQHLNLIIDSTTWLSTDLTRELNLFQDYLTNLDGRILDLDDNRIKSIGDIVRQDFIDFSSNIEKLAYKLFEKDLYKLKLNDLNEWHKYSKQETLRRLKNTELINRKDEIDIIVKGSS